MVKLGCKAYSLFGNSIERNLELIKAAGFDTTCFNHDNNFRKNLEKASDIGLTVEELEASFSEINSIWEEKTEGDYLTEKIRRCILDAAAYKIPHVVLRVTFSSNAPKTSAIALVRFGKLVNEAEKQGVKICLKNAEFVRHIGLLLAMFKSDNIGLCYDFGHEDCFTPGIKYIPLFGDKILSTRIHDNNGFPADKTVNSKYDLHRIPFDGSLALSDKCKQLKECAFFGSLMLDITNSDGFYNDLSANEFYNNAYDAALKLQHIFEGKECD